MTMIEGQAMDAKAGAVLVKDDEALIYIDGLASWPDEFTGKRVVVSGQLVEKGNIPQATLDETGAYSQGVAEAGTDTVLENAEWKLAE